MQRRPRQDPISCQLCRSKKLKCDRQTPCSNCVARGVTCRPSHGESATATAKPPDHPLGAESKDDVLQRLRRLEEIVFGTTNKNTEPFVKGSNTGVVPTPTSFQDHPDEEQRALDEDARELETVGIRDSSLLLHLADRLSFEVCDVSNLLRREPAIGMPVNIAIPHHAKALELLEHYRVNVDHTARVLHIPTTRMMVNDIYESLALGRPIASGQAALMLAVFTMSTYFSQPVLLAADDEDALRLAKVWGKGALDALDHSRRTTAGSLEDAQASILMSLVLYHFDGLSARGRQMTTNAIAIGRDLRLHLLDEWEIPDTKFTARQRLDREVRRRVWWHIASTDWILSSFGGPQEGAYFVHPKHMHVRFPNECSDEELSAGATTTSTPTPAQQYFNQRIKLAQLCCEVIDVLPLASRVAQVDYDEVKAVDQRLLTFLDNLPPILRLDDKASVSNDNLDATILGSRFFINTSAHGRRCKLHQPFLIRQGMDPRFEYSRRACLQSARTVFRLQQELDQRLVNPNPSQPQRLGIKTHFMQLATVVMVMDLCFNKDEQDVTQRQQEVRSALAVFEQAAGGSRLPVMVLKSLIQMLHKHNVHLPNIDNLEELVQAEDQGTSGPQHLNTWGSKGPMQSAAISYECPVAPLRSAVTNGTIGGHSEPTTAQDSSFDQFWQMAMEGEGVETLHWDHLFSDLDYRIG